MPLFTSDRPMPAGHTSPHAVPAPPSNLPCLTIIDRRRQLLASSALMSLPALVPHRTHRHIMPAGPDPSSFSLTACRASPSLSPLFSLATQCEKPPLQFLQHTSRCTRPKHLAGHTETPYPFSSGLSIRDVVQWRLRLGHHRLLPPAPYGDSRHRALPHPPHCFG
jgi:hypothetical protein